MFFMNLISITLLCFMFKISNFSNLIINKFNFLIFLLYFNNEMFVLKFKSSNFFNFDKN